MLRFLVPETGTASTDESQFFTNMIKPLPPIPNIAQSTFLFLPADLQIGDRHAMLNRIQHGVMITIFACCRAGGRDKNKDIIPTVLNPSPHHPPVTDHDKHHPRKDRKDRRGQDDARGGVHRPGKIARTEGCGGDATTQQPTNKEIIKSGRWWWWQ